MVISPVKTFVSIGNKRLANLPFLICVGLLTVTLSGLPFRLVNAEPIVILEYRGAEMIIDGDGAIHPFRLDPDYSTHHKVMQDETLSHIIANYYGGSGLDKAFVQMAIVKRNRTAFVRANPNYLFAGKSLHLPSLNEIRAMLVRETKSTKYPEPNRDNREEIFFFGS
tara:strand:+ start:189 stop:689 length:501 start_codon:yes stop_codon:yes gene_type:complete